MDVDFKILAHDLVTEGVADLEYLDRVMETVTSGSIGGFSMPMGISQSDPTMGGRNKLTRKNLRIAVKSLLGLSRGIPS